MASVELVQPVESTWLMPRSPSAIEISLETMPTIDTGMAYGDTRWTVAGEVLAVLPLRDVDAAGAAADDDAGVDRAGRRARRRRNASRAASTAMPRDLRVAPRIGAAIRLGASSPARRPSARRDRASSGTEALTRHGSADASNS